MSTNKTELMNSDEFEKAILEGVECKKNIDMTYKKASRVNYERFYETMLDTNEEVQQVLSIPKRKRTESQKELVDNFKKKIRKQYNFVTDFMMKEEVEEGKLTKIEKIVEKISYALNFLRFIGETDLDKTLSKYSLTVSSNDKVPEVLNEQSVKDNVIDIFNSSKTLKQSIKDENTAINEKIFSTKVPLDLQYDKNTNQSGLKPTDFRKLVDAKTKLEVAKSEEEKEKIEDKIQTLASNAQFDISRTELLRDKLNNL